ISVMDIGPSPCLASGGRAGQRSRSVSTMSIRTFSPPASAPRTVRSAEAVRPERPMTRPRSSGWTRTSRICPRRRFLLRMTTSSLWSTIPVTRCSSASSSISGLGGGLGLRRSVLRGWGLLGRGLGLGGRLGGRLLPGSRLVGLLLRGDGLVLGTLPVGGGQRGLGEGLLGLLCLGGPEAALGTGLAGELLPVTGDLEQRGDGLRGLGALGEPVLGALAVDLDERGLLGRVVQTDLLDGPAVPLGTGVHDDDAVEGGADLAHP